MSVLETVPQKPTTTPDLRLLVVHGQSLLEPGGAELSIRHHIKHAPARVSIQLILPDDHVDPGEFDVVLLGNLRPKGGLGEAAEFAWADSWSSRLQEYKGLVIRQEHDMHPCTYRDARCFSFSPFEKQTCNCNTKIRGAFEKLYNACSVIQFVSPMQKSIINQLIEIHTRQVTIAPPVDFGRFKSMTPFKQREPVALVFTDSQRMSPNAASLANDQGFDIRTEPYLSTPYSEMPALLNSVQAVVLDPVIFHACPRIAIEAEACGCQVIASNKVGSSSWPELLAASKRSNEEFWDLVVRGARSLQH